MYIYFINSDFNFKKEYSNYLLKHADERKLSMGQYKNKFPISGIIIITTQVILLGAAIYAYFFPSSIEYFL